ncbi:MAG: long-chain fatty acid--CoA ligase, partial [Melioribacteraceae bacterium]|nr:long-chain fatty acid--CoA ligase [Melioribacteraceae bacterium]
MIKTILDFLPYQIEKYPQEDAICGKENGEWKKYSSQEFQNIVDKVSLGLLKNKIAPGDKIAIISNNRPEWNFIDIGALQIGAVGVPMYPNITEKEYEFIFNEAEVKLVFVSDEDIYKKVKSVLENSTSVKDVYSFNHIDNVKHWSAITDAGSDADSEKLKELKKSVKETDLATIIYTSGTTGGQKGVMLSHKNVVSNALSIQQTMPHADEDKALSFLPLCHIFERTAIYFYLFVGTSVYYAESLEKLVDNLKEVKPDYFITVPRLLEKVYEKIITTGRGLTGIKKSIFFWAVNIGLDFDDKGNNNLWYNFKLGIARKLVFSKWQAALGGNIKGIIVGAAALQVRLGRIFTAAGIPVREGYGLTESSPVLTDNRFEEGGYQFGTVGTVIPNVEIKIAENGEILARGANIMMGYYKRPELTAETIDSEGWLHTGDVGEFIDGNFLKITDRLKKIFKTSGGKYIAPQPLENKMKESFFIEQVMVIGENRRYPSALIIPSFPYLKNWCEIKGSKCETNEELINCEGVQ